MDSAARYSITIRRLQVFMAVVDAKTFSGGAAALGVSQPSVSGHISALEERLGLPLFVRRSGSSARLTDDGRLFYEYAREAVDRAEKMASDLHQRAQQHKSRLRFATHRSVAHILLLRPLALFSEAFPHIELITQTGSFYDVCERFHNREVDLALMLSPGDVPGMETELIGRCPLAFFACPKHPLAGAKAIAPDDLCVHPFVSAYRESYLGRTIENLLTRVGVKDLYVVAQMHEIGMVRELVIAGLGISCSLRRNISRDIAAGNLVELDVDIPPIYLELRCARHANGEKDIFAGTDKLIQLIRGADFGE